MDGATWQIISVVVDTVAAIASIAALILLIAELFLKEKRLKFVIVRFTLLALLCVAFSAVLAILLVGQVRTIASSLIETVKTLAVFLGSARLQSLVAYTEAIDMWLLAHWTHPVLVSSVVATAIGVPMGLVAGWRISRAWAILLLSSLGHRLWFSVPRLEAAQALEESGATEAAVEAYNRLACDMFAHSDVRLAAADALRRLGEAGAATEAYLAIARHRTVEIDDRLSAVQELEGLNQEKAAERAWGSVARTRWLSFSNRLKVAKALVDSERVTLGVEFLSKLVNDRNANDYVRVEAAKHLQSLGEEQAATDVLRAIAENR